MKIIGFRLAFAASAVLSLSACTQSDLRLSPDFGDAEREDMAAQIADPDAHYAGLPAPGSNGARVGLAQSRYEKNQVIQPSSTTASSASSIGNADNGGGSPGATGGTGASAGMAPAGP
jgi:hypothetical protein